MGRRRREHVDQAFGSYHIVSRLVEGAEWFSDLEKEELLRLLERLTQGFFVQIHAFCIMSNHFHLLATGQEAQAERASEAELRRRYRAVYGKRAEPPIGALLTDGSVDPDDDQGVERLRERLGSVSRFVQELKQTFSRRYNKRHERKGYLWGDRFKAVVTEKQGDAEITQAAYIDLNPIRAKMVRRPEDYRWSSAGLKVRSPRRAKRLLTALQHPELRRCGEAWYRMFTYCAGAKPKEGKRGSLSKADAAACVSRAGELGLIARLAYRCRNLSEGVAVGRAEFVAGVQERHGRKHIRPRRFLETTDTGVEGAGPLTALFATRVLRGPPPST